MKQYVVDAFADRVFEGNPAAVCLPESWPSEERMMAITRENNLSETAFAVREGELYSMDFPRLHAQAPGGHRRHHRGAGGPAEGGLAGQRSGVRL